MATCNCDPGSNANGWHETRSAACAALERDAFARAMERAYATLIHDLRTPRVDH